MMRKLALATAATAIAAALLTAPFAATPAAADPPRWAPGHGGYRYVHKPHHFKFKQKHHHVRRHVARRHAVRPTFHFSRPVHDHRRHRHVYRSDLGAAVIGGVVIGSLLGGHGY